VGLNLNDKKVVVEEVSAKVATAQTIVVAEYRGIQVSALTKLRANARSQGVYLRVLKNTLARRAVEGTQFAPLADTMVGPLIYSISTLVRTWMSLASTRWQASRAVKSSSPSCWASCRLRFPALHEFWPQLRHKKAKAPHRQKPQRNRQRLNKPWPFCSSTNHTSNIWSFKWQLAKKSSWTQLAQCRSWN
jgi:hypothetical protein